MKRFRIGTGEFVGLQYIVEADNSDEAIKKLKEGKYKNVEIVDFVDERDSMKDTIEIEEVEF